MRWTQLPGCGPAGAPRAHLPARCIGLAEGYPLRFLYGYQGVPKIDKLALMKDWAQWSLISTSALYAFELLRAGRARLSAGNPGRSPLLAGAGRDTWRPGSRRLCRTPPGGQGPVVDHRLEGQAGRYVRCAHWDRAAHWRPRRPAAPGCETLRPYSSAH